MFSQQAPAPTICSGDASRIPDFSWIVVDILRHFQSCYEYMNASRIGEILQDMFWNTSTKILECFHSSAAIQNRLEIFPE